jgi:hypothetical protein
MLKKFHYEHVNLHKGLIVLFSQPFFLADVFSFPIQHDLPNNLGFSLSPLLAAFIPPSLFPSTLNRLPFIFKFLNLRQKPP